MKPVREKRNLLGFMVVAQWNDKAGVFEGKAHRKNKGGDSGKIEKKTMPELWAALEHYVITHANIHQRNHNRKIVDETLAKGLCQIETIGFIDGVLAKMLEHQTQWGENVVIRFGIGGQVASGGQGAKPNYQIESNDGDQKVPYWHHHKAYGEQEAFDPQQLSDAYSIEDLRGLWGFN